MLLTREAFPFSMIPIFALIAAAASIWKQTFSYVSKCQISHQTFRGRFNDERISWGKVGDMWVDRLKRTDKLGESGGYVDGRIETFHQPVRHVNAPLPLLLSLAVCPSLLPLHPTTYLSLSLSLSLSLESDCVECIWLELKPNANALSLFVCFLYRNPSVCYEWFDDFVQMIDNLRAAKPHADILLLGDFNIDLLKPHSSWDSTITLLGLTQLIESPTRITPTSATLIDHIYTNNPDAFTDVSVSDQSISDHCSISCTKSVKLSKLNSKPILLYHLDRSSTLIKQHFVLT